MLAPGIYDSQELVAPLRSLVASVAERILPWGGGHGRKSKIFIFQRVYANGSTFPSFWAEQSCSDWICRRGTRTPLEKMEIGWLLLTVQGIVTVFRLSNATGSKVDLKVTPWSWYEKYRTFFTDSFVGSLIIVFCWSKVGVEVIAQIFFPRRSLCM